ncbi:MAG: hypothetical protein HFACDABA_02633 [Anaerolineales bacterium]|nr:hypothetical protein [Anaerolineales bacterium]
MQDTAQKIVGHEITRGARNDSRATARVSAFLALIFVLSSLISSPASAQNAAYVEIDAPDTSGFPTVSTVLDVYDASGQFVSGLSLADVTMREDDSARPVDELTEYPVGAQIVVAFNTGPALGVRDGQGITRYQKIQRAIETWSRALDEKKGDDLSLVSIAGLISAHSGPLEFSAALSAFQPEFRASTPNIQTLSIAMDAALASTPEVGMKRAILFVTPHMEDANLAEALTSIGQRAMQGHVRIFIWLADSELNFNHSSIALFQTLTQQTGGSFVLFDNSALPDPETYFTPLRNAYRLTYSSKLNTTGDHRLSAEVNLDGARIASAAQTFALNVQAPNPIITVLPAQITRRAPEDDPFNEKILLPAQQAIEVIFDFPDGHQRPILSVTLFIDGQPAATNTSGALDKFTWDLSAYTESGQHTLRVEATDLLNLTGASLETPVLVQVVRPPVTPLTLLARYRFVIVGSVIAIAGIILFGILASGRLRLPSARARREKKQRYADPLTQPVAIASIEPPTDPLKKTRRLKSANVESPAALLRLTPDGEAASTLPIPIPADELTIGTDPVQASFILDEAVIAPLHARITHTSEGYVISDPGSAAGTWVNYETVTREGYPLKHGDKVHLGGLLYRFVLKDPPSDSEPLVTFLDP